MKNRATKKKLTITIILLLSLIIIVSTFALTKCANNNQSDTLANNTSLDDSVPISNTINEVEENETEEDIIIDGTEPYYYNDYSNSSTSYKKSSTKKEKPKKDKKPSQETTTPEKKNPFEGKKISVMGDSISTYTGWSDAYPITDETCKYRYGEAYYGPEGGDFHNTELLVTDTWWHQAATELGAEILMSNAGNSTGLFYASYPSNLDWQQYLQEMLAYKSRPYYMGKGNKSPDIIALYIGSNDVGKGKLSQFGSVDVIDFDELIINNEDGSYTYADPETVAESYCILLHKLTVTYPKAEIYCFTVVPNSGSTLDTCNKRLANVLPFNEMIKGVADYYGAITVDLFSAFQLDPDNDAVATQEDWDKFKTYFNGDPHPNAAGFDVITECFVSTIRTESKYK